MTFKSLPPVYDNNQNWPPIVTTFTEGEMLTIEGNRFYSEYSKVFTAGEVVYIRYLAPPDSSGFFMALQNRIFKSLNGEADLEILWDSTGVDVGAKQPTFNENRMSQNQSRTTVNLVTSVGGEGTVRESDFLTGSGAGSNSSGDVSPELGYRIYGPDSSFIAKITNLHNSDNRIKLSYSWVEPTLDRLIGENN